MTSPVGGNYITGELADFTDAVRRVPDYAYRLMTAVDDAGRSLDVLIGNSRLLRWLPFRIVSTKDLNELVIVVGKTEMAATALAEVGYYMATQDASLTNPWDKKGE